MNILKHKEKNTRKVIFSHVNINCNKIFCENLFQALHWENILNAINKNARLARISIINFSDDSYKAINYDKAFPSCMSISYTKYSDKWVCNETDVYWAKDNKTHRDDAPARIYYNEMHSSMTEEFYINGILRRKNNNEPAIIEYRTDDEKNKYISTIFFVNDSGNLHKENGPAVVLFDSKKGIVKQVYCRNGESCRLDGPAVIDFRPKKHIKEWHINGKRIYKGTHICIEHGKVVSKKQLDKFSVMETVLFDREYGEFLNNFLKAQENNGLQEF